jgi:hypothetical protein
MHGQPKWTLAVLLLAVAAVLLAPGCNRDTDDPKVSESQLLVGSVAPIVACADVDGSAVDVNGDGTIDQVFMDYIQVFTFENRTRGATATAGSVWNDAHLDHVDITYQLEQGSLPARANVPVDVTVKANSTATLSLVTVPAQDAMTFAAGGANEGLSTRGVVTLLFKGADAGGRAVSVSTQVEFGTYVTCPTQ